MGVSRFAGLVSVFFVPLLLSFHTVIMSLPFLCLPFLHSFSSLWRLIPAQQYFFLLYSEWHICGLAMTLCLWPVEVHTV